LTQEIIETKGTIEIIEKQGKIERIGNIRSKRNIEKKGITEIIEITEIIREREAEIHIGSKIENIKGSKVESNIENRIEINTENNLENIKENRAETKANIESNIESNISNKEQEGARVGPEPEIERASMLKKSNMNTTNNSKERSKEVETQEKQAPKGSIIK